MKITVQSALALAIFVPWLLGILAVQLKIVLSTRKGWRGSWLVSWKRWDVLDLCPRFTFFSWLPTVHYSLFVRDRYEGERTQLTPWRLVVLPRRTMWRFIWNPPRRVRFAMEDASKSLIAHLASIAREPKADGYKCFAYIFFQEYCSELSSFPAATERQFMLAQRRTLEPTPTPEPLFISPFFVIGASVVQSLDGNSSGKDSYVA